MTSLTEMAQKFSSKYRPPNPKTSDAPAVDTFAESRKFTDRSNCRRAMVVFAGANLLSPDEFDVIKKGEKDFRYQRRGASAEKAVAPALTSAATPAAPDEGGIPAAFKIPQAERAAAWTANPPKAKQAEQQENDMARKTSATTKASARKPVKEGARNRYDWNAAEELAAKGKVPPALDFSAPTHARFRDALAEVIKAAKAKDAQALKTIKINPVSSSPKALDRYRKLCVKAVSAAAA